MTDTDTDTDTDADTGADTPSGSDPGRTPVFPGSEMWNTRYAVAAASAASVWSLDPNVFVTEVVSPIGPGTAIDLGCGEGRNALWLAQRGWQVTGVDFSSHGLESGRRRAEALGLEIDWELADASVWVSPDLVDLVVVAYLQLDSDQLAAAISCSAAALESGGRIVLVAHDVDNIARGVGGPQNPSVLTSVDALRAAADAAELEIERCEQVLRPIGDGHAIDVVLIARRG